MTEEENAASSSSMPRSDGMYNWLIALDINMMGKGMEFLKRIAPWAVIFVCQGAFADQYLCPGNMNYVATGDTLESVIAACGEPLQKIIHQPSSGSNSYSQNPSLIWYYSLSPQQTVASVSNNGITMSPQGLAMANAKNGG